MKANNRLLQHYEMILKEELEKKQENYNQDKYVDLLILLLFIQTLSVNYF